MGFLMPAPSRFPSQLWHVGDHLNGVHFETALKSVCSFNPSLDAYFNSVILPSYKIYRRIWWKKLLISKINIKSAHMGESEKTKEKEKKQKKKRDIEFWLSMNMFAKTYI